MCRNFSRCFEKIAFKVSDRRHVNHPPLGGWGGKKMIIYVGSINQDQVYMLIGIPPNISVCKVVQFLKGKSSHKLLSKFSVLWERYWGSIFRLESVESFTSGNVTDEG